MPTASVDISAHLQAADIFACLDAPELQELADSAEVRTFNPGQAAVTQGESGSSLFVVTSGRLSVYIDDGGSSVYVGDLWDGEFFGEMSLLTGTPRTATVQAANTATVIEVTKLSLAPLMQRHGELASLMGSTLSERQSSNLKTLMEFEPEERQFEQERSAAQFSFRIRNFFELPTNIWSKAVDGIGSFSFGGPLGHVLGKANDENTNSKKSGENLERGQGKQVAFTTAIITLAAKMAAAGGSYSQREISQLQKEFDIPAGDMANVTRIFNRAQGSAKGVEPYAQQIAQLFKEQPAVLEELIGTLLNVATGAGTAHPKSLEVIEKTATVFGFTSLEFDRIRSMRQQNRSATSPAEGPHYLTVLSLTEQATPAEAKRAYHKLAMENHPDRLVSEGLPEELIKQANDKLVLINTAYEQFCAARGAA